MLTVVTEDVVNTSCIGLLPGQGLTCTTNRLGKMDGRIVFILDDAHSVGFLKEVLQSVFSDALTVIEDVDHIVLGSTSPRIDSVVPYL